MTNADDVVGEPEFFTVRLSKDDRAALGVLVAARAVGGVADDATGAAVVRDLIRQEARRLALLAPCDPALRAPSPRDDALLVKHAGHVAVESGLVGSPLGYLVAAILAETPAAMTVEEVLHQARRTTARASAESVGDVLAVLAGRCAVREDGRYHAVPPVVTKPPHPGAKAGALGLVDSPLGFAVAAIIAASPRPMIAAEVLIALRRAAAEADADQVRAVLDALVPRCVTGFAGHYVTALPLPAGVEPEV